MGSRKTLSEFAHYKKLTIFFLLKCTPEHFLKLLKWLAGSPCHSMVFNQRLEKWRSALLYWTCVIVKAAAVLCSVI